MRQPVNAEILKQRLLAIDRRNVAIRGHVDEYNRRLHDNEKKMHDIEMQMLANKTKPIVKEIIIRVDNDGKYITYWVAHLAASDSKVHALADDPAIFASIRTYLAGADIIHWEIYEEYHDVEIHDEKDDVLAKDFEIETFLRSQKDYSF